jgi:hypothetical protein
MTDKHAAKDEGKHAKSEDAKTTAEDGDRDDVAAGQKAMERDDIGAAALPDGPDTVKVITEVNPGTAN